MQDDLGGFAPFTAPLEKALRIKAMTDDIAARREQREQNRQAFQLHLEDRKRMQAQQDFQTALALGQMGAVEATPQVQQGEQVLDQAFGQVTPESRRPLMTTPTGKQYYVPTAEQRQDKADDREVARDVKKKNLLDPLVTVDIRGKSIQVRQSQLPTIYARSGANPVRVKAGERNGDVTWNIIDPQTQEIIRTEVQRGVGNPSGAATVKSRKATDADITAALNEPDPNRKGDKRSWREAYFEQIPQNIRDAAAGNFNKAGMTPGEIIETQQKAQAQIAAAEKYLREEARKSLEAGYANEANASRQGGASQGAPVTPKAIRATDIPAAAKQKGMTPDEFKAKWLAKGWRIDP